MIKKISALQIIPFISLALVFLIKSFLPNFVNSSGYVFFVITLVIISLISVLMLFYRKKIKSRNLLLLLAGLAGSITLLYFQYVNG